MCMEKNVLVKKGLVEKMDNEIETHWLSCKKKVQSAAVSKEDHADSILDKKWSITIDFNENGATLNSTSYCKLLREKSH